MIWMDVDVALSEVPVNTVPLTDDTDFKSTEEAVAYNATGMDLEWHFISSAGAYTVTAVTPTTGGNYDWTHQGNGMYTIEIPASGGASINNDAEGYGYFVGKATGILPWRGPTIGFRDSRINDMFCDTAESLKRLFSSSKTICLVTVTTGSTTTVIPTSSIDPTATATDQYAGRVLLFLSDTTTAALRGQGARIQSNTSGGTLTLVEALSTAPASGDTAVIV